MHLEKTISPNVMGRAENIGPPHGLRADLAEVSDHGGVKMSFLPRQYTQVGVDAIK